MLGFTFYLAPSFYFFGWGLLWGGWALFSAGMELREGGGRRGDAFHAGKLCCSKSVLSSQGLPALLFVGSPSTPFKCWGQA